MNGSRSPSLSLKKKEEKELLEMDACMNAYRR
jgi:hypothetical protein